MENIKAVVLAAGAGTRMKSDLAKVLHKSAGKTLLAHVLDAAGSAGVTDIAAIVGHDREAVEAELPEGVASFYQAQRMGTGHAVKQAVDFFPDDNDIVLVLNGDSPLISPETIRGIIDAHIKSGNSVTVLTAIINDPTGYGRIITEEGQIVRIVEERDANDQEKAIKEVNSGTYCFGAGALKEALNLIGTDNDQGEYYLTDAVEIIRDKGLGVGAYATYDETEVASVNSKAQLARVNRIFRDRINNRLMEQGVTIIDPQTTYIDADVEIGRDTVVYPGSCLEGRTRIGKDCTIGLNTHITDSEIADGVWIESSTITDSFVDSGSTVGPYAYIRPDSHIGKDVKVGDFVEVKNSTLGDGTKASHLTYIGDSDVGRNVNLGCGTVFVNYDGKNKHRTVVEDDCFIGCNTNLVSPVTVKKGSYTAAGSTITDDVPEDTLAIARARQVNKEGYIEKLGINKE